MRVLFNLGEKFKLDKAKTAMVRIARFCRRCPVAAPVPGVCGPAAQMVHRVRLRMHKAHPRPPAPAQVLFENEAAAARGGARGPRTRGHGATLTLDMAVALPALAGHGGSNNVQQPNSKSPVHSRVDQARQPVPVPASGIPVNIWFHSRPMSTQCNAGCEHLGCEHLGAANNRGAVARKEAVVEAGKRKRGTRYRGALSRTAGVALDASGDGKSGDGESGQGESGQGESGQGESESDDGGEGGNGSGGAGGA
jgi:hypothetical protein